MVGPELLLINVERVQIIGLGRFLPAGLAIDQRDVVQHRPEIGIREVRQLRSSLDRLLVMGDRCISFAEIITKKSQAAVPNEKGRARPGGELFPGARAP